MLEQRGDKPAADAIPDHAAEPERGPIALADEQGP
jgi:hypothetical protein